ncbi:MAG: LemA family protein [Nitrospirales bacterium]|nr:LemA family protein [Nitrospirales bacterium]
MVFGIIVIAMLMAGGCVYSGYNRVIILDEAVKSQWAQVENQLQRRFELLPNLVETVKGVAKQEQEIFLGVAEARKSYFQAGSINEKAKAAGGLEGALSRLLVLRETYPQLKSDQSFLKLQDQLEGTENRLSVERKRYNDAVRGLNTYIRKLLGRLYAGLAGVESAEYFEIDDAARVAPKVKF